MDIIIVVILLYISLLKLTHQNQVLVVVFVEQHQVITQQVWKQLPVQVEGSMEIEFL